MRTRSHVRIRRDLLCAVFRRYRCARGGENFAWQISTLVGEGDDTELMRPGDAEVDRFGERRFHLRVGEEGERIAGDGPVVMRAADRILECAMFGHKTD